MELKSEVEPHLQIMFYKININCRFVDNSKHYTNNHKSSQIINLVTKTENILVETGTIVLIKDTHKPGMVLTEDGDFVNLLLYDFTTVKKNINEIECIGHSDAIYKVAYDMMR